MKKDKKGNARSIVFLAGAGFLILLLGLLFTHVTGNYIIDKLVETNVIQESSTADKVLGEGAGFLNMFDTLVVIAFIGIVFGFIVTSWFVAGHPLGMVVYFIVGVLAVLVSMMVSNFWEVVVAAEAVSTSIDNFSFSNFLMNNLAFYIGVIWFIGLIITYVKPQSNLDGGGFA